MAVDTPAAIGSVVIRGNSFPIYGSQPRADEYFSARLGAENWTSAQFIEKSQGLVTARRRIDREPFRGAKTVASQLAAFPRDGETTIPLPVEFAQYEFALILLGDVTQYEQASTASNVKRLKAGTAEIEFFSGLTPAESTIFPDHIHDLLLPYLQSSVSLLAPIASGTNNPDNIVPFGSFGLADGW